MLDWTEQECKLFMAYLYSPNMADWTEQECKLFKAYLYSPNMADWTEQECRLFMALAIRAGSSDDMIMTILPPGNNLGWDFLKKSKKKIKYE